MKTVKIADKTLCSRWGLLSFKEKLEIARQLDKLQVDFIEFPEIDNVRTDVLLIRTAASFIKNSIISVAAGSDEASIKNAVDALSGFENALIRITLPLSPVCMEYNCHKKPDKMLQWIEKSVSMAVDSGIKVEFCAEDATRAEEEFLQSAIKTAIESGASGITLCDTAASLMPDDFVEFIKRNTENVSIPVGVCCNDKNGLACAQAIMSVRAGADVVKTAVGGDNLGLETFATMLKNCGNDYGFASSVRFTELSRIINRIDRIIESTENENGKLSVASFDEGAINLSASDDKDTVAAAVMKLGYDLTEEDAANVYEEFCRVASKKRVGAKELDAIVASTALQVPPTYKLESYLVNNGNMITASAQVTLIKDGNKMQGISMGDGPIDAAFLAVEQILGHHYELDDFQIQSVTEGKEAMGSAVVKLRSGAKVYSGNGISTDIIGASIRAYIAAVNKIVYEEA